MRILLCSSPLLVGAQQSGFSLNDYNDYDETHLAVAITYTALGCKLTSVFTKLVFFGTTYCF